MTEREDPVAAFLQAACAPRDADHVSGTLERAEAILAAHPEVAKANIHTAAVLGDEAAVRGFLAIDKNDATAKGGPHDWDALTYLCFSRYLRLDRARSQGFVRTAEALLDAGADANTGWHEANHQPHPVWESVIYGAAGVAHHPELTRLLLARGADPNDEETPYHAPEGYDNAALAVLMESGQLNADSLATLLLRKADWKDRDGIRLLLAHGADPNRLTHWRFNGLHQAVRRGNALEVVELLIEHGADPSLPDGKDGRSAVEMAARRERADLLDLFERRGFQVDPQLRKRTRFEHADPILRVEDMTAAVRYYVEVLGFENADWGDEWFTCVSRGGACIYLCKGGQGHTGGWAWIGVEDAEQLHEEWRASGARIRHPPRNYSYALEFHVEDLDGNVLRLGSEPLADRPYDDWLP